MKPPATKREKHFASLPPASSAGLGSSSQVGVASESHAMNNPMYADDKPTVPAKPTGRAGKGRRPKGE